MRKKVVFPVLAGAALFVTSFYFLFNRGCTSFNRRQEPEQDGMDKAMRQEFLRTRDPRLNRIPAERLLAAKSFKDARLQAMAAAKAVPGITWEERGPNNVGGRTRAIWIDRRDAPGYRKVWAGGVGGGLWVTQDITAATPVWTKINDFMDNLAITCIVQDPADLQVIYCGTGEGWFNGDAIRGLGIWKTTDGGLTWNQVPSTAGFYYVQDLLTDKNGHLYAAVITGGLTGGIMKSADGGQTWAKVLGKPAFGSSARGIDLELAANGDIYATIGGYADNGGIYRSAFSTHGAQTGNAGTWQNITPDIAGLITEPSFTWGRIELACAPSSADTMYALFHGGNSLDCISIQRYRPSSNTWSVCAVPTIIDQGSYPNFTRGQAWYDLVAAVDPNNAARLYIGGIDALRSDDAGATWTQMTAWSLYNSPGFTTAQQVHADHHAIEYIPGSSSRAVWGTDGGIYYTSNANTSSGKPVFTEKNNGYNITQYYAGAMHPTDANYFLAGAQDNGSHKFTTAGMNAVTYASGGDGGFCYIDQDNPNLQITSYVNNNYFISTDGGASFFSMSLNNRGGFINPTAYDDTGNVLYGGDNAGAYFRWTNPEIPGPDAQVMVDNFGPFNYVTHVAVSPITSNRVFFGMGDGSVVMVDDAHTGTHKTGVIIKPAVAGSVSCIAIDPADENHLLVTYSNYGVGHVYETRNALAGLPVWTATDGDLPDMPVRWALFDPRDPDWAIIATELGVWSTDNLDGGATNWMPTNSGLANVRVDMIRYRPADRTLLAATHGRGLFTAVLANAPVVTTPDIAFKSFGSTVTEQTTGMAGCRSYRDYPVVMTIANAPAGDATITVNIQPGSTATRGLDFDYTTNGDFIAPANSFVFKSGVAGAHTITVRVYDDVDIEYYETITLGYTISGTTNAQPGTGSQTYTFKIYSNDKDKAPLVGSPGNYSIGVYNTNLSNTSVFRSDKPKSKVQTLFTAQELQAAGLAAPSYITALTTKVVTKNSTRPFNGLTISMTATDPNPFFFGVSDAELVSVFSGNYTTVAGDNTIPFTTPFLWDGVSDIVVQFCFDNSVAGTDAAPDIMQGNTEPLGIITYSSMLYGSAGSTMPACAMTGITAELSRINVTFTAAGTPLATNLNTSRSEYLGPQSDVYFYDATGAIMARIHNLGSHDYGCTQVVIDRAGTGATRFWNNVPVNYLMDKTFRVIPANNDPSGAFGITLYFSAQEVNGWEAATGQSFASIQLIKLPGLISGVTPATPEPDGPGTVQVVDPVRASLGVHATLSYTFNNGFSGFGAGIAGTALPVRLTGFAGQWQQNQVVLSWTTSMEQNSKAFEIERSYDGITFTRIGVMSAAGTSFIPLYYQFIDRESAAGKNYYRLKQVDLDNRHAYSNVIMVTNPAAGHPFRVLGNPVWEHLDLQFNDLSRGLVQVQISDMGGRVLMSRQYNEVVQQRIHIALPNKVMAKGMYLLKVRTNGKDYVQKIIKE